MLLGASQGGLAALRLLLAALPAHFPAALVIVLHRRGEERGEPGALPGVHCALPFGYPVDKERILPGQVYLAPPDYHLLVEGDHFALTLDAPENYVRPAIDVLFESAAEAAGRQASGLILSGTGCDGARGLAAIQRHGGRALVQSPDEADSPQMPLAALAATPAARVLRLAGLAAWLQSLAPARMAGASREKKGGKHV